MKKIVDECCDCAVPAYPCLGNSCPRRNVERYFCDNCDAEIDDELYEVDGEDLCIDCLKERFKKAV